MPTPGLAGDEDVDRSGGRALGERDAPSASPRRAAPAPPRREPRVAQRLGAHLLDRRRAALHDQHRGADLDRVADPDRDPLAALDRLVFDPRAVDAAQILQRHRLADVQASVRARRQRIVDPNGVGLAAADGQRTRGGEVVGRVGVAAHDQQEGAGRVFLALSRDDGGPSAHRLPGSMSSRARSEARGTCASCATVAQVAPRQPGCF